MSDERQGEIVARFTALYYDLPLRGETGTWLATSWLGVPVLKAPTDLWAYQEILSEIRPDLIVETGTAAGGSALFLASICDQLGHGRVLTVDIDDRPVLELAYNRPVARPMHPRIRYLHGSSIAPEIVAEVRREATGAAGVLVGVEHRRQVEPVAVGLGEWHADVAGRVADHERDQLGRRHLGREDEVALVLPVLVVDHDDGPAGLDVGYRALDAPDVAHDAPSQARCRRSRSPCDIGSLASSLTTTPPR
jgi:hypothetical protein